MAYNLPIGSIYHLYTTYILPSGGYMLPTTLYRNLKNPLRYPARCPCQKKTSGENSNLKATPPITLPSQDATLPETNRQTHLKIGLLNRKVVFQPSISRGKLLVSGRVSAFWIFLISGYPASSTCKARKSFAQRYPDTPMGRSTLQ